MTFHFTTFSTVQCVLFSAVCSVQYSAVQCSVHSAVRSSLWCVPVTTWPADYPAPGQLPGAPGYRVAGLQGLLGCRGYWAAGAPRPGSRFR
jgi:hypothetical protein